MLQTIFPYGLNDWYDYSLAFIMAVCTIILIITLIGEIKSWATTQK